jgi:cation diffusion facilitator CzcD-associated flavoprotein CzcO
MTAPGCKRIIADCGYLDALSKPNVSITYEGIDCVVPKGIKLKNGEVVPLDVIVYSTGFDTVRTGLLSIFQMDVNVTHKPLSSGL